MTDLFVITGGPGSGKTTLLKELEQQGFRCSHEVARQIIQEQVAANGDALPWANTRRYTELMLARSIAAYRENTPSPEIVFMDRGIPDAACYARLIGLPSFRRSEDGVRDVPLQPDCFPRSAMERDLRDRQRTQANLRRSGRHLRKDGRGVPRIPAIDPYCLKHLRYRELSLYEPRSKRPADGKKRRSAPRHRAALARQN